MELQTILGTDKGRNAFYKARDNFTTIQSFINQLKAADVKFDNTDTGLTAEDVQAAINELNDNFIELHQEIENLEIQRGYATTKNVSDFNLATENGRYAGYNAANSPGEHITFNVEVIKESSGVISQLAIVAWPESMAGDIYARSRINSVDWTAWVKIATNKQPNWISATLQNGWTGTLQYRKNQIGQLEIDAVIKSGTTNQGTVITTLPVGYRPYIARVPLLSAIGNDQDSGMGIVLADDGKIMVTSAAAGTSYTSNWYINATINHLQ